MTTEVTCPTCGTVSQLDEVNRDAGAFCRVCDYPLFWIRTATSAEGEGGLPGDPGLRRLPGTGGLVTVTMIRCWNCNEPNPITGVYCIRCGEELHPAPPVPLLPPPLTVPIFVEPPPEPLPPKPPLIPWAWVPAAVMAFTLAVFCLVGAIVAILH